MKSFYKLISAIVVAVVLTAGVSSFLGSRILGEREEKIVSLQKKIVGLQEKLSDKETAISSLESRIDNTRKFWRLLLNGMGHLAEPLVNKRVGSSYFDDFHFYYEEGYYEQAKHFADKTAFYYDCAKNDFLKVKVRFLAIKKYASDDRSLRLVENYIKLCEYGTDASSEMHQAGEYLSTACDYYAKEEWSLGYEAVEEANEHMEAFDSLVEIYDECLSNIISLLKS